MGNAFNLKSGNFADVAVAKVNFQQIIPCTGITLSPSTLSIDTAEGTGQLTAVLTPEGTTETVYWTSSDENVASVDSNGLVTVHGIGTAAITATCGEQTATLSINQTMLKAQYPYLSQSGFYAGADTVTGGKILGRHSQSGQSYGGWAYHNTDDLRIKENTPTIECVRVPYGATKMKFATVDGEQHRFSYMECVDTTSLLTVDGKKYPEWTERYEFVYSDTGHAVSYGQAFCCRGGTSDVESISYIYFE